jgi:FtsZ-interacting cell division protein YlmF
MNQTILAYLHLLVWPTLIIFLVLWFRATIVFLLHERLVRINAGGISAEFEKAAREAVKTVSPSTVNAPVANPTFDMKNIRTFRLDKYDDLRNVGNVYRNGIPVILDVTGMTDSNARRAVDFSAGMIYVARGTIDKITNKVFLLTPPGATEAPAPVPVAP